MLQNHFCTLFNCSSSRAHFPYSQQPQLKHGLQDLLNIHILSIRHCVAWKISPRILKRGILFVRASLVSAKLYNFLRAPLNMYLNSTNAESPLWQGNTRNFNYPLSPRDFPFLNMKDSKIVCIHWFIFVHKQTIRRTINFRNDSPPSTQVRF